jgi:dihydrofolate synthase / folylpolyglutamate synthase
MTPEESIHYLLSLQPSGIKLGLENMRRLCAELEHPEKELRCIHIAGTNGKGSVAAMMESVLRQSGYRTGLYTSPHLIDFSERIRVDGKPLDSTVLAERVTELRSVVEKLAQAGVQVTFFEATTALAFAVFRDERLDWVVLETGLGGRLDSTNVVVPVVTAITSIGMDHMEYLGSTLAEIAGEKAGILKSGCPLVLGVMGAEARDVIRARAESLGVEVVEPGDGLPVVWDGARHRMSVTWRDKTYDIGLVGQHQAANAAVALGMIERLRTMGHELPESGVREGLSGVVWPGRFEILQDNPSLVLDGGHNPAGLAVALEAWRDCFGGLPGRIVFGCMRDKAVESMIRLLDLPGVNVWLVPVGSPRTADPRSLSSLLRKASTRVFDDLAVAYQAAMDHPEPEGTLVLGSLYLAGEWKALSESRGHQLGLNG